MNFMVVANEVIILFFMMAAGFLARRRGLIDAAFNTGLAELVLNVTLPLMILGAFNISIDSTMASLATQVFIFSLVFHIGAFLLSGVLFRGYRGETRNVLRFSAVFSNCVFMGYPVLQGLYGQAGVFYGSIFTVPFIISLWTIGVFLFRGKNAGVSWQKVLFNPGILAVVAGTIMFWFSLKLPAPVARACDLLGGTTTPMSMILIGSMLGGIRVRELWQGWAVYHAAIVRLLVIPLLGLAVLCALGVHAMVLGVCVISLAMPVAANTAAFAGKFGSDGVLASRCVFVSTLLSVATIPVFVLLVQGCTGKAF